MIKIENTNVCGWELNYAVLRNMYYSRKNHKLDEWRAFCEWSESLPHSELITGGVEQCQN